MPDLYNNSTAFQELVSDINSKLNINWNGFFWPLDTMLAFGSALSNFSNNSVQAPALQIVCSYYGGNDTSEGYQDGVSGDTFKTRLKGIMRGMKALDMISPSGDPDQIVELQCDYAVIAPTPPPNQPSVHANHAKVVVVDDVLCYVGSDNAYPSYNTEFGLWHGDTAAIVNFVQEYWTGLWAFASQQ
jgi:phosphatidylserine/phosphatidylglycerophosphate/cardiolipin synthase-like enzyme